MNKIIAIIISTILVSTFVSAQIGYDNPYLPKLTATPTITSGSNNNTIGNVNSSNYWGNYLYTDYNMATIKLFGYNQTIGAVNPFDQVLNTTSNVSFGDVNVTGHLIINSSKGQTVHMENFVVHTQELMTDTLLDKSRSSLSCVGGKLNYTLYAFYGDGQFNFGGVLYPSDHSGVDNATITLTCGTDITPVTNYVYLELVGGVPTMKTSSTYPTSDHIDTATFVVGACSGSTYNIYSYSRNRYEVDSFVKRVLSRFEDSGTLYVSGFVPDATTTKINVTSGGKFFNGIFEMTSTNMVDSSSFYYINGSGNFKQATDLSIFIDYANGVSFSGGVNERINIVWGLVPVNTTGGVGPTQMRLVAVLPNEPTIKYNTIAEAIADIYETTNYYPPNDEIKKVFVPIARTILKPNTDLFELFSSGKYYKDIRGAVSSGGGSASLPITAGDGRYLLLNGSNANSNIDIGGYDFECDRLEANGKFRSNEEAFFYAQVGNDYSATFFDGAMLKNDIKLYLGDADAIYTSKMNYLEYVTDGDALRLKSETGNVVIDAYGTITLQTFDDDISLNPGDDLFLYGDAKFLTNYILLYGQVVYLGGDSSTKAYMQSQATGDFLISTQDNLYLNSTNITLSGVMKLTAQTLPVCNLGRVGSISRNNTNIYMCNSSCWIGWGKTTCG